MDPDLHPDLAERIGGLALLHRWKGFGCMKHTRFMVPVLIVVYNMFMNAVDRFDQKRAACAILWKEMRVSQSIFTWILDAACINANALRRIIDPGDVIDLPEFKRRVALDFVMAYMRKTGGNTWNTKPRENNLTALIIKEDSLAPTTSPLIRCQHDLVDNVKCAGKRQIFQGRCVLCTQMGARKESKYGCTGCRQYFHVACFNALHKNGKLKTFAQLSPALAANAKVVKFVTGESFYNNKDQANIGTVESIMPYEK